MTAPDFIWAEAPDIFDDMGVWHGKQPCPGVAYVRLDPVVLAELPEVKALVAAALKEASLAGGNAAVEVLLRHNRTASPLQIQMTRRSVERPIERIIKEIF